MITSALMLCSLNTVQCTPTPLEVKQEIVRQAEESEVDVDKALSIANCESNFKWDAKNPHSTATGIYQFTKPTWDYFCEGDRLDFTANIRCFMKLYPKYPHYWECK